MRVFVDTNLLLYAVNRDAPEHSAATHFLQALASTGEPWCLSWPVVYEFLRVSTHARVFRKPLTAKQAVNFLKVLLESPGLAIPVPSDRHLALLEKTLGEIGVPAGNLFHDIATAVLMREHGIARIATADTDFLQFRFLQVTDPVHPRS